MQLLIGFIKVGVPLMVQVVLSILKPAGSVGAIVQLAIAPPELLKVMSVMAEPITAPMEQSRRGVPHLLEAQMRPLVVAILRFTQLVEALSPLKIHPTLRLFHQL
jgi:hypothetical protein